jgi:hypothetical protein
MNYNDWERPAGRVLVAGWLAEYGAGIKTALILKRRAG